MKKPIVSIVIPCYNYGQYLAEAVQSALNQTYSDIEVLVVDDGSTDTTAEVAKTYGQKISYFHKSNGGLSDARNFGVSRSHGDYVVFLDADDKLAPTFSSQTVATLERSPQLSFVYTQVQTFGRERAISQHPMYSLEELKRHNYINAGALLRSAVFEHVRYSTTLKSGWEDWDFYISLAERGFYGQLLDEPLLLYRKHADLSSMTDQMMIGPLQRRLLFKLTLRHARFFGLARIARLAAFNLRSDVIDLFRFSKSDGGKS